MARRQLRSLRGAGVVALDDELSLEVDDEDDDELLSVDVAAGAAVELSVDGLFDVSLPCVLDGAADCVLLGIARVSDGAAGVVAVEEVDDWSVVVCATAKPMPASRAAAAATADNFFW